MTKSSPEPGPLISIRAAVVLLLALAASVFAGGLAYLSDPSVPAAVLVGGGAGGGALLLFHNVIDQQ